MYNGLSATFSCMGDVFRRCTGARDSRIRLFLVVLLSGAMLSACESNRAGEGPLVMSDRIVDWYVGHLSTQGAAFAVTPDGTRSGQADCPVGKTCRGAPGNGAIDVCNEGLDPPTCRLFAFEGEVVWQYPAVEIARQKELPCDRELSVASRDLDELFAGGWLIEEKRLYLCGVWGEDDRKLFGGIDNASRTGFVTANLALMLGPNTRPCLGTVRLWRANAGQWAVKCETGALYGSITISEDGYFEGTLGSLPEAKPFFAGVLLART